MNRNNRKRQWAASLVAILFVMVNVFNVLPGQASADTPLTVAQAIAKNNNGSNAVVEGFIVGEVFNSKPIFTNFGDDFNLLLADTPGEQDKTKLIDVQIPSNFRTPFGLKTNPTLVGKKIQVTGTLATYSSMAGIKPATAFTLTGDNGGTTPDPSDPGSENIGVPTTLPNGVGKKVLFDETHGQTAGAADWVIDGAFSDFADGLKAAGFQVDALQRTLPMNAKSYDTPVVTLSKLKQYDVFIIGEANIPFKTSEQDAMLTYVKEGGSIFFIADHYNSDRNLNRWDSSEVMNGYRRGAYGDPTKGMSAGEVASGAMQNVTSTDWLGQNFGIRFRYNSIGDVTKSDTVKYDQSFGITAGVNDVEMHSGSTLVILNPKVAKGVIYLPQNVPGWSNAVENSDKAHFPNGGVYKNGGVAEGPYAAIAKLNKGKAAFIGDSSPVEDASPAYVREDTGAKKTTYDGFKGEAQDAVFLVQTVEWLAVHEEDYATFENKGITLDAPTPLLGAFEEPATSAEIAGTEPWTTPVAGYKWYDPSTYKAGSYGSGASGPVVTIPDLTSIASARQVADSSFVTVQGVITSEPGIFGGTGFYMQDGTAGIYVYPSKATGYHVGDKLKITAQKTTYNTEAELLSEVEITKLDDQASIPTPVALLQTAVNDANQGQLISIQNAVISKYAVVTGSLEFDLVNGSNTNHVRIDSRTNINADLFKQTYPEGTAVNITGISSIFKGVYQLKLLNLGDIRPSIPAAENHPPVFKEVSPQNTVVGQQFTLKVEATDEDGDAIVYSAVTLPDGASFNSAGGIVTWTPVQTGVYDIKIKAVDSKNGEATLTVQVTVSAAQTGADHTATLTGPISAYPGTSIDLPIGVIKPGNGFTALDVIVHYDSSKLDVATIPNLDGTLSLADSAVTSSREGLGLLASGVKPDQGLIRIIMGSAGAQHAVIGSGEILKLHVKFKANLPDGKTDISLSDFQVSLDGAASTLDTTTASWSIEVKSADRTALNTAINSAQSLYDQAVVGSNPGQYPVDAKSALQQAITAASAVRNNAAATQQELNNAITELTNAVNIFKNAVNPSVPTVPADKVALINAITAAQNLYDRTTTGDKVGQYPADAKSTLKLAIQNAQGIKNSASSTQAQVDAATASLNSAAAVFQTKLVTLVPGATKISIQDLSIISKYYGVKSTDPNWSNISKADLFGEGEISIRVLASVAQMIIGDWYVK